MTENANALSLATNFSIVPFKLFLTVPAVSLPGLYFRALQSLLINTNDAAHTQNWQKYVILHLMQSADQS